MRRYTFAVGVAVSALALAVHVKSAEPTRAAQQGRPAAERTSGPTLTPASAPPARRPATTTARASAPVHAEPAAHIPPPTEAEFAAVTKSLFEDTAKLESDIDGFLNSIAATA